MRHRRHQLTLEVVPTTQGENWPSPADLIVGSPPACGRRQLSTVRRPGSKRGHVAEFYQLKQVAADHFTRACRRNKKRMCSRASSAEELRPPPPPPTPSAWDSTADVRLYPNDRIPDLLETICRSVPAALAATVNRNVGVLPNCDANDVERQFSNVGALSHSPVRQSTAS